MDTRNDFAGAIFDWANDTIGNQDTGTFLSSTPFIKGLDGEISVAASDSGDYDKLNRSKLLKRANANTDDGE